MMPILTSSAQHYIQAIYELARGGEGVRVSDIAAELGVTKASSCIAMKALQKKRLVYRDASRSVFLTGEGERQAILSLDKAAIIRRFLIDVLGISQETADADACAMEHVISTETLCSLCRFTNRKCTGACHEKKGSAHIRVNG